MQKLMRHPHPRDFTSAWGDWSAVWSFDANNPTCVGYLFHPQIAIGQQIYHPRGHKPLANQCSYHPAEQEGKQQYYFFCGTTRAGDS